MLNINNKGAYFALIGVALCLVSSPRMSHATDDISLQSYLSKSGVSKIRFEDKSGVMTFYEDRLYEPVWLKGDRFSSDAKSVISLFEDSWMHGLNPDHYAVSELQEARNAKKLELPLYYDVLLSAAVVRYGRDLTSMRVPASEIEQESKFWRKPIGSDFILGAVSSSRNARKTLESFAPQSRIYKQLQGQLVSLLDAMKEGDETESVLPITFRGSLRVGDSHAIVPDLRHRLNVKAPKDPSVHTVYDDMLAQAVMSLQSDHGLKADGIIGGKTKGALNRQLKDRVNQVLVNLERVRWLEPDLPEKYIIVNIPAQTLWAVDDNKVKFEMPVIIGRKKRQTKSFVTTITGVRFNPTWTVPETIKFEDYLPKLQEDPNYLNDKGIEFVWGRGSDALTLPPESIQWAHLSENDIKSIRMVQGPGSNNPLGRIRLHMPNQYNIYLHDTNNKGKFTREDRALSSGCVRMLDPHKIAEFVLADNNNWSEERMTKVLDKGEMKDIGASNKIPVYLLYQTIWENSDGELTFGGDVYGQDALLAQVLRKYQAIPAF